MEHLSDSAVAQLVEGLLSAESAAEVHAHADGCPACLRLLASTSRALVQAAAATAVPSPAGGSALPLRRGAEVGRYVILHPCGAGGMGVVYAAYDPELDRKVALKLLRPEHGKLAQGAGLKARIVREAQALARLSHPNVVAVHDLGAFGDQIFVAMEFVEGGTLAQWLLERPRPWDEVLALMLAAAAGLAAAHRAGLVHRDFKPDNVLVGKDGRVQVTDFGLVGLIEEAAEEAQGIPTPIALRKMGSLRAVSRSAALTATGEVVGSPAYMAPEQMLGRPAGPPADVFSFCVALYEALYGERPFAGGTFDELRSAVLAGRVREPAAGARVPAWVRRAVLRGLHADPAQRYASIDELAGELRKDPRGARRRSLALLAALVAAAVPLAMWASSRAGAARQAQLAQRFGQAVERIEGGLQKAYLLPLHDTRPERERVRSQMRQIEEEAQRMGRSASAAASAALGRGHLALGELQPAREKLEAAWAAGERSQEVAYALGRAWGALYQRGLRELNNFATPAEREARRKQLEAELRDPALRLLHQGEAAAAAPRAYVEALVAFHEGRWSDALAQTGRAFAEDGSLYQAKLLEGMAHVNLAIAAQSRSAFAEAAQALEAAGASLAVAAQIGRSDPAVHEADCERWANRLTWEGFTAEHGKPEDVFSNARGACERALAAYPGAVLAHVLMTRVHVMWGEWQYKHGLDGTPTVAAGIRFGEEALALDPREASALALIGLAHWHIATYRGGRGLDPDAEFAAAAASLERAIALEPRAARHLMNLGNVLYEQAIAQDERGADARAAFARAVATHEKAAEINPRLNYVFFNLGVALTEVAERGVRHGVDPRPAVAKALDALERSAQAMPAFSWTYRAIGAALLSLAVFHRATGEDAAPHLERAAATLRKAIALEPDNGENRQALGRVQRERARGSSGAAALAALDEAAATLAESVKLNGNDVGARVELALTALDRAALSPAGAARREKLASADAALAAALAINPRSSDALAAQARAAAERATLLPPAPAALAALIDKGLAAADAALRFNPACAAAAAARGHLLLAGAGQGQAAARQQRAAQAVAAFEQALQLNQFLRRELEPARARAARTAE